MSDEPLSLACVKGIHARVRLANWTYFFPDEDALVEDILTYCRAIVVLIVAADGRVCGPEREFLRAHFQNPELSDDELETIVAENLEWAAVRWTPKVGQVGSLTQSQQNDPHVEETPSA